jgi:hypothetical protein
MKILSHQYVYEVAVKVLRPNMEPVLRGDLQAIFMWKEKRPTPARNESFSKDVSSQLFVLSIEGDIANLKVFALTLRGRPDEN